MDFPKKVDLNLVLNLADYLASDLVSVYPKTIDHFNMKLNCYCFVGILQVLKTCISKV